MSVRSLGVGHKVQRQSGTKRDDWLVGDNGNDTLVGLGGNDKIFGFAGDDNLDGGTGNDTLDGGVGNDFLVGGSGNDTLTDTNGEGTLDGGVGSDHIEIAGGAHTVFGGLGNDIVIIDESAAALISGGDDDDLFCLNGFSGNQDITIDGGSGTDVLQLFAWREGAADIDWSKVSNVDVIKVVTRYDDARLAITDAVFNGVEKVTVVGTSPVKNSYDFFFDGSSVTAGALELMGHSTGDDTLIGGAGNDALVGLEGRDELKGGGGNDTLDGGGQDDVAFFTGNFADYEIEYDFDNGFAIVTDLLGRDGSDLLTNIERMQFADQMVYVEFEGVEVVGTNARDRIHGTDGDDRVLGNGGDDGIDGNRGEDTLDGGAGDDVIRGGRRYDGEDDFFDVIFGGAGDDHIIDRGHSRIDAGEGDDEVSVQHGVHSVVGGEGNDTVYGEELAGTFVGGEGDDVLAGAHFSGVLTGDAGDDRLRAYAVGGVSIYGGDGSDAIYAEGVGTFYIDAGSGDDTIEHWPSASSTITGGEGADTLRIGAPERLMYDWSAIVEIETLQFAVGYNQVDILLDDEMFFRQAHWILDVSDKSARRPSYDYVLIDGSAITAGALTLIGNNDRVGTLIGGAGDDTILGLDADDELTGGVGDDRIDGGGGSDIAVFEGRLSDYTIVYDIGDVVRVVDNAGHDGTDTLINVEKIRFADGLYEVLIQGSEIRGSKGSDRLTGTEGSDRLLGLGGNDTLNGLDRHDYLDGGAGDDILTGGADDDTLLGGIGNDLLRDANGNNFFDGGAGNDNIIAVGGLQTIVGGDGNDIIETDSVNGTIEGGAGDDHIVAEGTGSAYIDGGAGDDVIERLYAGQASVSAGSGDDFVWLRGVYGPVDKIDGGEGFDVLRLGTGGIPDWSKIENIEHIQVGDTKGHRYFSAADEMFRSQSQWTVEVAEPDDTDIQVSSLLSGIGVTAGRLIFIGADASRDSLVGGALDDQLFGKAGGDTLFGYLGDDYLDGGIGSDVARYYGNRSDFDISFDEATGIVSITDRAGDQGTDTLMGVELLAFDDENYALPVRGRSITGSARDDSIEGSDGNDTIFGAGGDDVISGGLAHDHIDGGAGNDRLFGKVGTDILIGGEGNDVLTDLEGDGNFDGGKGNDTIVVRGQSLTVLGGEGDDAITLEIPTDSFSARSLLVDAGDGNDSIDVPYSYIGTFLAGDGDDRIDLRNAGYFERVDGGDGWDRMLTGRLDLSWTKVFDIEEILLDTRLRFAFDVGDNIFVNQDHWTIEGLPRKTGSEWYYLRIDATTVTAGRLTLIGMAGLGDTLIGGSRDDELAGLSGADWLSGGGGDDVIDGGVGLDRAAFSGDMTDYTITIDEGTGVVAVAANDGSGETDTLKGIEVLVFRDQEYDLNI